MKKIETVLDHLVSQPIYATLRQQRCFRLIKKALPRTLQRGILFLFVKEGTLFFALKHPAFKMEFDYKLSTIKNLLTTLPLLEDACGAHEIKDVRAFVSRFAPAPKKGGETVPRYRERAEGSFRILGQNEKIREEFEALKETIRCSRH